MCSLCWVRAAGVRALYFRGWVGTQAAGECSYWSRRPLCLPHSKHSKTL